MSEIPSFQVVEFEFTRVLVNDLTRLGAFATTEFRVPGTDTSVDVYIASPVRAFVEIKIRESATLSAVLRLTQQTEEYRRRFGDEIVPIIVMGGQSLSSQLNQQLLDAGFFIVTLKKSETATSSAQRCAREIMDYLSRLPYQFKIEFNPILQVHSSEPQRRSPRQYPAAARPSTGRMDSLFEEIYPSRRADAPRPGPAYNLERSEPNVDIFSTTQSLKDELSSASDIFFDVLVSLKSILSPEQFDILDQELSALSEEYRHEHYTACALRIGRTLEHVVYALARAWGVNVNRATLEILSNLENSFEQLSRAVVALSASDEDVKAKRKKAVQEQVEQVSGKLLKLVFDLDSELNPKSTDIPINVESIVRDIRKQFGRRDKVLRAVNVILNEEIIRKILNVRNGAAHASTSGVRRELEKHEIDAAVELLRTALFLFGNVAFAVAEQDG